MKKVFIITDDSIILYGLQALLNSNGFVSILNNGQGYVSEIINQLEEEKPLFVLLDLILPGIDGFELLSAIKSDPLLCNTPIFVFSHISDNDARARSERLGADYHFVKHELNLGMLISTVLKIMKNKYKYVA